MRDGFPGGRAFAFTILDDTDDTTRHNGPPIYALLRDLGLFTTKTVWVVDVPEERRGIYHAGETLASPNYAAWVRQLADEGFEIAFHNAAMASSLREVTIGALDQVARSLPHPIRLHCNHGQNRENLFWGAARYRSWPLHWVARLTERHRFEGERQDSPYYWADVANDRLAFIRSMAFTRLDGEDIPPGRPYRDPTRLSRPIFFNTADAPDCAAFNQLVTPSSLDALRARGGWAIVSTHLGKGFCHGGQVDATFRASMEYLATLGGWYVPVSTLLDFLVMRSGAPPLSSLQRLSMEAAHVIDRLRLLARRRVRPAR